MKIKLSERMQKIADMVLPQEACADIGTDHGYIPAYLLQRGICSRVILSDIARGPLEKAKSNLLSAGIFQGEFRLGAGMEVLEKAEVSTVIIAGMGGELIRDIVLRDPEKSKSVKRLILQPRTRADEMRLALLQAGFTICDYALAKERGRICEILALAPTDGPQSDNPLLSDYLLQQKDPLLPEFISGKLHQRAELLQNLQKSEENHRNKAIQLEEEIQYLKNLL